MPTSVPYTIRRLQCSSTGLHFVQIEAPLVTGLGRAKITLPAATASNARALKDNLLNAGFAYPFMDADGKEVSDFASLVPSSAGVLADVVGWHGAAGKECFLLPDGMIGDAAGVYYDVKNPSKCLAHHIGGELKDWKLHVATPALASRTVTIAVLAALSGPLQYFSTVSEGTILNLAGTSSTGKSTAVAVAASVWGSPSDIARWNGTERGLIEAAAANSDLCFVVDDIEQADPSQDKRMARLVEQTHLLTSGTGKMYSERAAADDLRELLFRNMTISSSPETVESYTQRRRVGRTNGDRVRLLEVRVPEGAEGGIWKGVTANGPVLDGGVRSDDMKRVAGKYYGTAGRALVTYLISNRNSTTLDITKFTSKFIKKVGAEKGSVDRRIAHKVALWYAAGRFAIKAGCLPWTKTDVLAASIYAFNEILQSSGLADTKYTKLKFFPMKVLCDSKVMPKGSVESKNFDLQDKHAGYYCSANGLLHVRLIFLTAQLKASNGGDVKPQELAMAFEELRAHGGLQQGGKSGPTKTIRFKNGKSRMLVFKLEKLNAFLDKEANAS